MLPIAPGPRGLQQYRTLLAFRKDPLFMLAELRRRYGDYVRLQIPADVHFVFDPAAVRHVLHERHTNYRKGFEYKRMKELVGDGLLTSEGALWKRQRRLMQPAFHKQRIAGFAQAMSGEATVLAQRWAALPPGTVVDVAAEMTGLTLAILGRTLFAVDLRELTDTIGPATSTVIGIINHRVDAIFATPLAIPTPTNRRFLKARAQLDAVVYRVIAERRRGNPEEGSDLISMLLSARDEDTGEQMSDRQLRDELLTMLLAGHETTANALAWTFHLLLQHPAVADQVAAEADGALREPVNGETARKLPLTQRVLEESLRLYPPAWIFSRAAIEEDAIGGFRIPKGSTIVLAPYLFHRDARFWEHPETFDPSRFEPARAAARDRFVYFPFAAGPRQCIGNAFAMMEMQLVLAQLVRAFRFRRAPGHAWPVPEPLVTLRPKNGVRVQLERR